MNPVHCTGCRRRIGFAASNRAAGRIWCSHACMYLPTPSTTTEARDDVIFLLAKLGQTRATLAKRFNLTWERIDQIFQSRGRP